MVILSGACSGRAKRPPLVRAVPTTTIADPLQTDLGPLVLDRLPGEEVQPVPPGSDPEPAGPLDATGVSRALPYDEKVEVGWLNFNSFQRGYARRWFNSSRKLVVITALEFPVPGFATEDALHNGSGLQQVGTTFLVPGVSFANGVQTADGVLIIFAEGRWSFYIQAASDKPPVPTQAQVIPIAVAQHDRAKALEPLHP